MAKVKDYTHAVDTIAANSFLDAMQEWFSTFSSFFAVEIASNTSVRIVAGTGNDQVGIGITQSPTVGAWRYRSTTVTASHPGGGAGLYDVYVTASAPNVTAPDTDNTDYNFGLEIRATGSPPSTWAYRKIAVVSWDGTKITAVEQYVGRGPGTMPPGAITQYAGAFVPAGWLFCDGSPVSRTTYSALFAAIGTTYGAGDGSTTFNLPDMRGKVPVGRDAGQTEFDTLGETGGSKTHTLVIGEMPAHSHRSDGAGGAGGVTGTGATGTGTSGNDSPDHGHSGVTATDGNHRHLAAAAESGSSGPFALSSGATAQLGSGSTSRFLVQGVTNWTDMSFGDANHAHSLSVGGASARHQHSVPALTVPALSISVNGGGGSHNNLQPYIALNHIIKT